MSRSDDPIDIFLHIPKTAGTTLGGILDSQYGRKRVVLFYNQPNDALLDNLDAYVSDPSNDLGAVIGHFGSEIVGKVIRRPARYATFLRDPVRRTLSDYHERRTTRPQDFVGPDGLEISLLESLDIHRSWYINHQTRYLSGLRNDGREPNEADLQIALNVLEQDLDFVGLVERFDEGLKRLSSLFGWHLTQNPMNRNVSAPYHHPESAELEMLDALNGLDKILYERANQLYTTAS